MGRKAPCYHPNCTHNNYAYHSKNLNAVYTLYFGSPRTKLRVSPSSRCQNLSPSGFFSLCSVSALFLFTAFLLPHYTPSPPPCQARCPACRRCRLSLAARRQGRAWHAAARQVLVTSHYRATSRVWSILPLCPRHGAKGAARAIWKWRRI